MELPFAGTKVLSLPVQVSPPSPLDRTTSVLDCPLVVSVTLATTLAGVVPPVVAEMATPVVDGVAVNVIVLVVVVLLETVNACVAVAKVPELAFRDVALRVIESPATGTKAVSVPVQTLLPPLVRFTVVDLLEVVSATVTLMLAGVAPPVVAEIATPVEFAVPVTLNVLVWVVPPATTKVVLLNAN